MGLGVDDVALSIARTPMAEAAVAAVWPAIQTAVIASSFATLEQRADAVLGCLRRVMPFRAGQISLVDMERRQAVLLAAISVRLAFGGASSLACGRQMAATSGSWGCTPTPSRIPPSPLGT